MGIASDLVMGGVGITAKTFLKIFTQTTVYNLQSLIGAIEGRSKGTPLITVANHTSTLDDPLLWGILPLRILMASGKLRWSLGAEELLFTNPLLHTFFSTGQVIPVRRGAGLNQPAMSQAINLLNKGEWIHVFPEGRVYAHSVKMKVNRLKWGIAHLIINSTIQPMLLPIVHKGFENVKPIGRMMPRLSPTLNAISINIGDPIDTSQWIYSTGHLPIKERMSEITQKVRDALVMLY